MGNEGCPEQSKAKQNVSLHYQDGAGADLASRDVCSLCPKAPSRRSLGLPPNAALPITDWGGAPPCTSMTTRLVQFLIKTFPFPRDPFSRGAQSCTPASCRLGAQPGARSTVPKPRPIPAPLCQSSLQGRTPSLLTSPPPFLLSSAFCPSSAAVPICSNAASVGKDASRSQAGMVPRWAVKSSEGNRGLRFQANTVKAEPLLPQWSPS